MAEVLLHFDESLPTTKGPSYAARACGREADDGRWEGWIEFLPDDGSRVLRTPRETTQPDRGALAYWATGLTRIYLEGALARALEPPRAPAVVVMEEPTYPGPAPDVHE